MRLACLGLALLLGVACRHQVAVLPDVAVQQNRGLVRLAPGVHVLDRPLRWAYPAAELLIEGAPEGTLLRASPRFRGRALIELVGVRRVRLRHIKFEGNRQTVGPLAAPPPAETPFAEYVVGNGILAEFSDDIEVTDSSFSELTGFAILARSCRHVRIERVRVVRSGSRNATGRNNTTGGILLEEGTEDFVVRDCHFEEVAGNGLWTHSRLAAGKNRYGLFENNRFFRVGRDAIQVGHAEYVTVRANRGRYIGYPFALVDVEGGGIPVALDTAGQVRYSRYEENQFEEINGKCIDLDGFVDGWVERNRCINNGQADDYPLGQFAIVLNNSHRGGRSERVRIVENWIDGANYGGLFLLGRQHWVIGNTWRRLNLAGCPDKASVVPCHYSPHEPWLLASGLYLAWGGAQPDPAQGNRIEKNRISGHRMDRHCIVLAPGVSWEQNLIRDNVCEHTPSHVPGGP